MVRVLNSRAVMLMMELKLSQGLIARCVAVFVSSEVPSEKCVGAV